MHSAACRQEAAACQLAASWGWCGAPLNVLRHDAEGPPMPLGSQAVSSHLDERQGLELCSGQL